LALYLMTSLYGFVASVFVGFLIARCLVDFSKLRKLVVCLIIATPGVLFLALFFVGMNAAQSDVCLVLCSLCNARAVLSIRTQRIAIVATLACGHAVLHVSISL